jgi:hypothetical protein
MSFRAKAKAQFHLALPVFEEVVKEAGGTLAPKETLKAWGKNKNADIVAVASGLPGFYGHLQVYDNGEVIYDGDTNVQRLVEIKKAFAGKMLGRIAQQRGQQLTGRKVEVEGRKGTMYAFGARSGR